MITYDPDERPRPDPELVAQAAKAGLRLINVACIDEGATVEEPDGVNFIAFGHFIPNAGDLITLEDGSVCRVRFVQYRCIRKGELVTLLPNVIAFRVRTK